MVKLQIDNKQYRMTALIRMEPNTTYAAHRHTASEELYVLEGTYFCGRNREHS